MKCIKKHLLNSGCFFYENMRGDGHEGVNSGVLLPLKTFLSGLYGKLEGRFFQAFLQKKVVCC